MMVPSERVATVQPAMDAVTSIETMGALSARASDFFSHPRKFVVVSRFINERGADKLDIVTGVQAGPHVKVESGGNAQHEFCSIWFDEVNRVSFSADRATSVAANREWDKRGELGVTATQVRFDGNVGAPSNFDTFEVEYWNRDGVGMIKTFTVQR